MYLIHSYSHSFRTRDVKAGKVYDVVFRVTDERGNVRQKRLSGFATKQNAEKAFVEYVAKFCTLVEDHPSRSECPSFAAVADKYLEYSRFMNAASTAIKRMSYFSLHYLPRFGALPLNRISSADVFRWFDALVSEPRRHRRPHRRHHQTGDQHLRPPLRKRPQKHHQTAQLLTAPVWCVVCGVSYKLTCQKKSGASRPAE